MTEADWLSCTDPVPMLDFLQGRDRVSDRKLRLFAVACSRRIWTWIDPLGRSAVEVAEHFADGQADAEQLRAARLACKAVGGQASWYAAATNPAIAARNAALSARAGMAQLVSGSEAAETLAQAELLRDIFGNPFRSLALDPNWSRWNGGAATLLARDMYETRDFSLAPLLADMLEDAGATDAQLLEHLRGPGPHAKGCFAIDLALGKE